MLDQDTIAAIATPAGKGGIGIVRISGKQALAIGKKICRHNPRPRYAHYGNFYDSQSAIIDRGLAIYFPCPHSFTGEDVVELHAHGSHILLDLLLAECLKHGARQARPGEFSERAFLNDKLDLTQAEAIADIIESNSVVATRSALRSLTGEFSERIEALIQSITELRTYVEAAIDFPEEEIDFLSDSHIQTALNTIIDHVDNIQQSGRRGSLLSRGLNVLILGKPNAGKSSLLNTLAGQEQAIVTAQAGTTRDLLRETIEIDGLPLNLVDTAGLRQSSDCIEQEGIRRAANETTKADLILFMQDVSEPTSNPTPNSQWLATELAQFGIELPETTSIIVINNKIDLAGLPERIETQHDFDTIWLSAKSADSLQLLSHHIKKQFGLEQSTENSFTARRRHLDCLDRASVALNRGKTQLSTHQAGELLAEDLRAAQDALGEISGKLLPDALLGEIFSSFCIGK